MTTLHSRPIYLDHNATTPIHPEVRAAMLDAIDTAWGNPSSAHAYGRDAHDAVERARAEVAALIGAKPNEIAFTSGGTESNNLAIRAVTLGDGAIVTSAIEHPAVRLPCERRADGRELRVVGVDSEGVIDVDSLGRLAEGAALVSIMHANNETGVLQPVSTVARIAKRTRALVHTDAAQSVGKVPVDVQELGVDLLTIAGHKLCAPKGVGALFVRGGLEVRSLLLGAAHERGRRSGTENVIGIVGLGAAAALARRTLAEESVRVGALRDRLVSSLRAAIPDLVLHGEHVARLPNTASVRFPRASGSAILSRAVDVAASTGAACHAGAESASTVITAMGITSSDALGTVRLSLGRATTVDDVDRASSSLVAAWRNASAR